MGVDGQKDDLQGADARKALERFVVDNDDLLTLESRIGKFNIFDALRITEAEIRHSNFLAFLLDPAESHGQGQLFLKAVLMDLLKNAPSDFPLSPIDLDGIDLRGVDVKREWKNLDLLITCKEPLFAVVVENKVRSQEHSDQLSRYEQTMTDHFPDLPALYIYLTIDGDEPSEDAWLPYRYQDICRVLKRVRETYQMAIGDEVLVFLDHYLNLLGTRFMNDEKLDELCQRIYKNHRQALDLIWERVGSPESAPLSEFAEVLGEDARWHVHYRAKTCIDFVPATWQEWLPPFGPEEYYTFGVSVWGEERRLVDCVFVGPMKDLALRAKIISKLREESPKLGFIRSKTSKVGDTWARICAKETFLEWEDDAEPDRQVIRESATKKLDELFCRLEKLALVLKPLCKPS